MSNYIQPGKYKLISRSKVRMLYKQVDVFENGEGRIELDFSYDEYLKDEIKSMSGARWNPESKRWSIDDNRRNLFQFQFLQGINPYKWYDQPLIEFTPRTQLFPQQYMMAQHGLTYRQVIWAAEMGLGKTLAAIEVMEQAQKLFNINDWWWIGPHSALASFDLEVRKWGLKCYPEKIMTPEGLVKTIKTWPRGLKSPRGVIFDESSRFKTPTSQRTQAADELAKGMRDDHGENVPFIIELTGTPSPKTPLDWYSQCEIAKPGFLREGNIHKFRERLSITIKKENKITGGVYPEILGWRDSDSKCAVCGYEKEGHDFSMIQAGLDSHEYVKGVNEVAKLYKRMQGLVTVYFKKDYLKNLPEKNYRILSVKPNRSTQNAANAIAANTSSAAKALILLRELSDGFQYEKVTDERTKQCPLCEGRKQTRVVVVDERPENFNPQIEEQVKYEWVDCSECGGTGEVPVIVRNVNKVHSPKVTLLESILDDHEDGRLVIYAGFTGSIDIVQATVESKDWLWIRVDGRGWQTNMDIDDRSPATMIETFQKKQDKYTRVAFIGHPGSAGMGLTLTASNEIVYFSNDFNAESRIQSEDRIHRLGMDVNRGATITDIIHLPSDALILDNLKKKRRLQDMTLGLFHESLKMAEEDRLL